MQHTLSAPHQPAVPSICPNCGHHLRNEFKVVLGQWEVFPHTLYYGTRRLEFTPQQHRILHSLARSHPRPMSSQALILACCDREKDTETDSNLIQSQLCRFRRSLRELGIPDPIETFWGRGYAWRTQS